MAVGQCVIIICFHSWQTDTFDVLSELTSILDSKALIDKDGPES